MELKPFVESKRKFNPCLWRGKGIGEGNRHLEGFKRGLGGNSLKQVPEIVEELEIVDSF